LRLAVKGFGIFSTYNFKQGWQNVGNEHGAMINAALRQFVDRATDHQGIENASFGCPAFVLSTEGRN
jgi:hypothetical protein